MAKSSVIKLITLRVVTAIDLTSDGGAIVAVDNSVFGFLKFFKIISKCLKFNFY